MIDTLLSQRPNNGIYWDELSYSKTPYHYSEPWDQCSGDIDRKTGKVIRLKSSVALLTKPWRLKQAKKIQQKGLLLGNGPLFCDDIRALNIQTFVETARSEFAARAQLYSPIALGNHLIESDEGDCYRNMLSALDYGCVYAWYSGWISVKYQTLAGSMYPITPIELGPGYIIGEERIITRKSGWYGWNDTSSHELVVFDATGRLVEDFVAPQEKRNGNNFTKLELPPNFSAVIIKK
ncbi:hypothetical protein SDC9_159996 [bioreactor metagenome]|uniref:Uncharacterized protein n=1 Tax=bioreactor metagenome TaxID=1076179 RepID=A0A645FEE7_9ZZZZ